MCEWARNIRTIRKYRGMTQSDLAEKASVARTTIISYEKGKAKPSMSTFGRLAEAMNVPVVWFFITDENMVTVYLEEQETDKATTIKKVAQRLGVNEEIWNQIETGETAFNREMQFIDECEHHGIPGGIIYAIQKLNAIGKLEAIKRIEELTQLPQYTYKGE